MGLINRDKDTTEKQFPLTASLGLVSTGQTTPLTVVPFMSNLTAAQLAATGLSGSPNYSLWASRLLTAGITTFNVGASLVAANFGVSGGQSFVCATGVTLNAGDVLYLNTAVANTAAYATVTLVLKALEDFRNTLGAL